MSAQDNDIRITFNLNELVEIRAKLLSQGEDYSDEIVKGEWLNADDIDEIAVDARIRLTWDTMYGMIDDLILEYLDIKNKNKPNYGEIQPQPGRESELTKREAEAKKRKAYFDKNFDMVELDGGSWKMQVPVRKKK
tara:strand:+ start:369 stop:776 length:408 start_codon:yes stop_codon:yes gene_type:complete